MRPRALRGSWRLCAWRWVSLAWSHCIWKRARMVSTGWGGEGSSRRALVQAMLTGAQRRSRDWKGGFPGGSAVKNLPTRVGDIGMIPGPGGSHILCRDKPVYHSYWACALGPRNSNSWAPVPRDGALQPEKPLQWEAQVPQLESGPRLPQLEKVVHSNGVPAKGKKKKKDTAKSPEARWFWHLSAGAGAKTLALLTLATQETHAHHPHREEFLPRPLSSSWNSLLWSRKAKSRSHCLQKFRMSAESWPGLWAQL